MAELLAAHNEIQSLAHMLATSRKRKFVAAASVAVAANDYGLRHRQLDARLAHLFDAARALRQSLQFFATKVVFSSVMIREAEDTRISFHVFKEPGTAVIERAKLHKSDWQGFPCHTLCKQVSFLSTRTHAMIIYDALGQMHDGRSRKIFPLRCLDQELCLPLSIFRSLNLHIIAQQSLATRRRLSSSSDSCARLVLALSVCTHLHKGLGFNRPRPLTVTIDVYNQVSCRVDLIDLVRRIKRHSSLRFIQGLVPWTKALMLVCSEKYEAPCSRCTPTQQGDTAC
mmetsp:Transcript_10873/g.33561  ORF Transcript_10873/g.33561 Transcript_10873/m.33561 type:complete len:284 (+) Transcript_10873:60-911(+)